MGIDEHEICLEGGDILRRDDGPPRALRELRYRVGNPHPQVIEERVSGLFWINDDADAARLDVLREDAARARKLGPLALRAFKQGGVLGDDRLRLGALVKDLAFDLAAFVTVDPVTAGPLIVPQ